MLDKEEILILDNDYNIKLPPKVQKAMKNFVKICAIDKKYEQLVLVPASTDEYFEYVLEPIDIEKVQIDKDGKIKIPDYMIKKLNWSKLDKITIGKKNGRIVLNLSEPRDIFTHGRENLIEYKDKYISKETIETLYNIIRYKQKITLDRFINFIIGLKISDKSQDELNREEEKLDNLSRGFREILKPYISENRDIKKVMNKLLELVNNYISDYS